VIAACAGAPATARHAHSASAGTSLRSWPEFGLTPQRLDATNLSPGIDAGNVHELHGRAVALPGTVDSSPVFAPDARVGGFHGAVIFVDTTYGRTVAITARSGRLLWTYTPPGYSSWAASPQITTSTPLLDPDGRWLYAASPNGRLHKLSLANGRETRAGHWPVSITRDPEREKIASALNIDGRYLIATTGGYIGDTPPYQGHVILVDRSNGRIVRIFNTLCSGRRYLQRPATCPASDSAILSRAGAVVEPGGRSLLVDTGNGPWNGRSDFGDSVLELTVPHLDLRQAFTPRNQEELNLQDIDLGSSAPALLGGGLAVIAGKDGVLRLLSLHHLDGHNPPLAGRREALGGELERLSTPGGGELFTAPAVWHHGGATDVFVADFEGTAAFALRHGRLVRLWEAGAAGTSPIVAGGLLYVYEPNEGGIEVYRPLSPHPLDRLPGSPGHWNSPIVVDGFVVEPEGDANEHLTHGRLEIFSLR